MDIQRNIVKLYYDNYRRFKLIFNYNLASIMRFVTSMLKDNFQIHVFEEPTEFLHKFNEEIQRNYIAKLCYDLQDIIFSLEPTTLLFGINFPKVQFNNVVEGFSFLMIFIYSDSRLLKYFETKYPDNDIFEFNLKFTVSQWMQLDIDQLQNEIKDKLKLSKKRQFFLNLEFEHPVFECSIMQSPARDLSSAQLQQIKHNIIASKFNAPRAVNTDAIVAIRKVAKEHRSLIIIYTMSLKQYIFEKASQKMIRASTIAREALPRILAAARACDFSLINDNLPPYQIIHHKTVEDKHHEILNCGFEVVYNQSRTPINIYEM